MRQLREKYNLDDSSTGVVTKDDIEDVVARWTGVPMTSIKEEEIAKLLRISAVTVRWHLSIGRREMARSLGRYSGD